jgi:hypothetical protein
MARFEPSPALLAAASSLSVDRVTAEVVDALAHDAVEPIVLKGSSFASWLYDQGELRPYGDTDLLVAEPDRGRAEKVLGALGFGFGREGAQHDPRLPDGLPWIRNGYEVDLHVGLPGATATPSVQWSLLSRRTEAARIGGVDVRVLGPAARAVHVALHAAHHGKGAEQPLADLERALARLPIDVWEEAAMLASHIGAAGAFATGLRLRPAGVELAARFALPYARSVETVLRAESAQPLSIGVARLMDEPGLRAKLARFLRKLFPPMSFMRIWAPTRRLGFPGLLLGYLWRPLWLAARAPRAFLAWRRASRAAR